jgi:tRNA(adenine34) deaminase
MDIDKVNYLMSICMDEAQKAFDLDEVPIGAVITNKFGDILSLAHNTKEREQLTCNHAEILAISEASQKLKNWRLIDCDLYVTLEPCPMCMSAISQSRIKNLYFGTYDPKGGAISLGYNLHKDSRLNHKVNVYGGFKHIQCAKIISKFFKQKRRRYKS